MKHKGIEYRKATPQDVVPGAILLYRASKPAHEKVTVHPQMTPDYIDRVIGVEHYGGRRKVRKGESTSDFLKRIEEIKHIVTNHEVYIAE